MNEPNNFIRLPMKLKIPNIAYVQASHQYPCQQINSGRKGISTTKSNMSNKTLVDSIFGLSFIFNPQKVFHCFFEIPNTLGVAAM
jgi:hypothetical protein